VGGVGFIVRWLLSKRRKEKGERRKEKGERRKEKGEKFNNRSLISGRIFA
jgi:hypothetical protein